MTWQKTTLGNFINVKHGYAFKGDEITKEETSQILVTPGNFHIGGGFKSDRFKYFLGDYPSDYALKENDIVVTMTDLSKDGDTLGYGAKIPRSNGKVYLHNQRIGLVQFTKDGISKDFLYWVLRTPEYQGFVLGAATGTSVRHTAPSTIKQYTFLLPPPDEQKVIATTLGSLDDKIDLLHRQNQTLEAMTISLFRQWFVEEAQDNWDEVKLGDFFPVVTGKKDANFSTEDGEYPFFTCSQAAIKAPSYSFEGAAILLAGNGDFNVKRYIGKFEAYQRTYVLIPYEVKYFGFLYTLMRFYLPEITGGHRGSVINFITKGMIAEFKFSLPSRHINIDEMLAQFNELYEKIDSNKSQIQTLETLRDTLLPKLMSGEVKVAC